MHKHYGRNTVKTVTTNNSFSAWYPICIKFVSGSLFNVIALSRSDHNVIGGLDSKQNAIPLCDLNVYYLRLIQMTGDNGVSPLKQLKRPRPWVLICVVD